MFNGMSFRNGLRRLRAAAGFTLMEVNLAIFIMATGVLAMVSLYPLAYRENQQSKDDVKAAAAADAVLNQLRGALSSRAITWDDWKRAMKNAVNATGQSERNGGWAAYCDTGKGYVPLKKGKINNTAKSVFNALANAVTGTKPQWPLDNDYVCAIVAQPGRVRIPIGNAIETYDDWSRVAISLRISRNSGALFAQPIYFTEIHFQGDQKNQ